MMQEIPLKNLGLYWSFAIHGEGFFVVGLQDESEMYYTRRGDFIVNDDLHLVTKEGDYVFGYEEHRLDKIVPIRFTQDTFLEMEGSSIFHNGNGYQIAICTFDDFHNLVRVNGGKFLSKEKPCYHISEEVKLVLLKEYEMNFTNTLKEMREQQSKMD